MVTDQVSNLVPKYVIYECDWRKVCLQLCKSTLGLKTNPKCCTMCTDKEMRARSLWKHNQTELSKSCPANVSVMGKDF